MKKQKYISVLLAFSLIFSVLVNDVFSQEKNLEFQKIEYESKIFSTVSIEHDFCGSTILVVLDKNISAPNKKHEKKFFGNLPIENIQDLTEISADTVNIEIAREDGDTRKYEEIVSERIAQRQNNSDFRQILALNLSKDCKQNVLDVIKQLEQIDGIISAEVNGYRQFSSGYNAGQWSLPKISLPGAHLAWGIATGSSNVRVGIIDTGISNHSALNTNLRRDLGARFVNGNIVRLSNGQIDREASTDISGHGTKMAGIIGSVWNGISGNNGGVGGICQNVSIIPLRADIDKNIRFNNAINSIAAINYADVNIIPILNASYGNTSVYGSVGFINAEQQAIKNYFGLFIAAAGNYGLNNNNPSTAQYPASYDLPNIISVAASCANDFWGSWVEEDGTRYSNFGSTSVHLFAPGINIRSTCSIRGCTDDFCDSTNSIPYCVDNGTSFAAPHVAGVAALIKSAYPNATTGQLKWAILNGVDTIPDLTNLCITGGRLNAYGALKAMERISDPTYGIHHIRNEGNGRYLSNPAFNGATVSLVQNVTNNNQRWIIQRLATGNSFEIRSWDNIGGQISKIRRNGTNNNNPVGATIFNGTPNSKTEKEEIAITVQQNTDGTVTFKQEIIIQENPRVTRTYVLDVNGTTQARWVVNNGNPTSTQRWRLETQQSQHQKGDVERDGNISIGDSLEILKYVNGTPSVITTSSTASYVFFLADIDRNGLVERCDAIEITKRLAGHWSWLDVYGNGYVFIPNGLYNIQATGGRFLHVDGGNPNLGARLLLWDNNNNNSRFHFQYMGDGYYRIRTNLHNNRYVEVQSSSHANGAVVQLWEWHNGNTLLWQIQRKGDYYVLVNKNSRKAIEITNNQNFNGALAQQWELHNGSGSQLFNLVTA